MRVTGEPFSSMLQAKQSFSFDSLMRSLDSSGEPCYKNIPPFCTVFRSFAPCKIFTNILKPINTCTMIRVGRTSGSWFIVRTVRFIGRGSWPRVDAKILRRYREITTSFDVDFHRGPKTIVEPYGFSSPDTERKLKGKRAGCVRLRP